MKVGVVGASGYAGGELLRLLAGHPNFAPSYLAAGSNAGELITSVHSHLTSFEGQKFNAIDLAAINELDLLFVALPHGESAKLIGETRSDLRIVDLGADFRLKNSESWGRYYGGVHAGTWTYGLPELFESRDEIRSAHRIANPGCYATAVALAVAPMISDEAAEVSDITVVAASGTTGAGRSGKISISGSEVMNSLTSYKFGGVHQHTPEIEESLTGDSSRKIRVSFTPILAPMPRGILATVTFRYSGNNQSARERFQRAYDEEPFVTLLSEGRMPETSSLIGSNSAHLQLALDEHTSRLVISIAIDNLGKGAAGQAIQNANLIAGFSETTGLSTMGIGQ